MVRLVFLCFAVIFCYATPYVYGSVQENLNTSLFVAIESGDVDLIVDQIYESEDLDAIDSLGNTALMRAAARGGLEAVKLLVEAGANIDKVTTGPSQGEKKCALTSALQHQKLLNF